METRRYFIKNMSFIEQELLQRTRQTQVRGEKSSDPERRSTIKARKFYNDPQS